MATIQLSQLDQRASALVFYDVAETPGEFSNLLTVRDAPDPPVFSFSEHQFSEVKAIIYKVSSADRTVLFYKTSYPIALLKRDQLWLVPTSATRVATVKADMLRITGGFEVMLVDDEFYILNFSKFERAFAYTEIEQRAASRTIEKIVALGLVADLKGHLANGVGTKRDIRRAASSPVFDLEVQHVLDFVREKSARLGLVVVNGQIQLTSHATVKRFYQLMNDDLLTSGLTAIEYETLAKNPLN